MVIHASDLSRANACASLIFLAKRSLSIAQWYTSRSVTHPGVSLPSRGWGSTRYSSMIQRTRFVYACCQNGSFPLPKADSEVDATV